MGFAVCGLLVISAAVLPGIGVGRSSLFTAMDPDGGGGIDAGITMDAAGGELDGTAMDPVGGGGIAGIDTGAVGGIATPVGGGGIAGIGAVGVGGFGGGGMEGGVGVGIADGGSTFGTGGANTGGVGGANGTTWRPTCGGGGPDADAGVGADIAWITRL